MELFETFRESLNTLFVNKMRTGLATLGIIIGIGSVITLISLGQASQQAVQNQIQSLGTNLLTISPGSARSGFLQGAGSTKALTYEDAKAISTSPTVTTIKNVSPEYQSRTQASAGRNNTNTQVIGVVAAYTEIRKLNLQSGTFISQRDVDSQGRVAVLGPQVVTDLFGEGANPVGQSLRIKGAAFRIIGVAEAKGGSGFQNQDDRIYVPLTTAQEILFGSTNLTSIAVEAKSEDVMIQAQDQVGYLLLARHKLTDPTQADFSIISQSDLLGTISQVTGTFTSLLAGIAAISLLVGGIGIMNIMLVTVTERTREIGLKKALGAKKRMIINQFLTESVILTGVGGAIGLAIGFTASYLISKALSMPFVISPSSVFLALGVSGGIGIIFGWYPARRAASLNPIDALRYE